MIKITFTCVKKVPLACLVLIVEEGVHEHGCSTWVDKSAASYARAMIAQEPALPLSHPGDIGSKTRGGYLREQDGWCMVEPVGSISRKHQIVERNAETQRGLVCK